MRDLPAIARTVLGTFAFAALCSIALVGCIQAGSGDRPSSFSPYEEGGLETDAGAQADGDASSPTDWVPEGHAVKFHRYEESQAIGAEDRAAVQSYKDRLIGGCGYNCNDIAWRLPVGSYLLYDSGLAAVSPRHFEQRGAFFGLGGPFIDEHLHMFECGGAAENALYALDDYFLECRGSDGVVVYFRTQPGVENQQPPEPPQVSEHWQHWWREIYQPLLAAREADEGLSESDYLTLPIFVAIASTEIYQKSPRLLRVNTGCSIPCQEDMEMWYFPLPILSEEQCSAWPHQPRKCREPNL